MYKTSGCNKNVLPFHSYKVMKLKSKEMSRKYFLYCMNGETNLELLIKNMQPQLQDGEYIFACIDDITTVDNTKLLCFFKEKEGYTVIAQKHVADSLGLSYQYVAAWITLTVHSSLEAVGLTASFSTALANAGISCNVVAAFHHDHIFVDIKDAVKAMDVLEGMSK
jgi:hypothetical protein